MVDNNKNTLTIIIAAVILFLGMFLGSLLLRPATGPTEAPQTGQELWFVYAFSGEVTGIRDNILLVDGELKDPQGNPVHREAVITTNTNIVLREREIERDSSYDEEYERLQFEDFRKACEHMESINWDPTVIPRTLHDREIALRHELSRSPVQKEIAIEEIKPGDKIRVSSNDNIAANTRFEATTIFINRY